jgi:hypothetical protein
MLRQPPEDKKEEYMSKLTIDIREKYESGLDDKEFADLLDSYAKNGTKIDQIYCRQDQKEAIETFAKKTDPKTKKSANKFDYGKIILTVE